MGTETDFLVPDRAVDPRLVARFAKINGVDDPLLMAWLVVNFSDHNIDFNMFEVAAQVRRKRGRVRTLMSALQKTAKTLMNERSEAGHVDILTLALMDLQKLSSDVPPKRGSGPPGEAARLIDAIELIANFSFAEDLGQGGRPVADEAILKVVLAVAVYCDGKNIPFTGGPRIVQTVNAADHWPKSTAARIVADVLICLGLKVPNSKLATFMNKARDLHSAF